MKQGPIVDDSKPGDAFAPPAISIVYLDTNALGPYPIRQSERYRSFTRICQEHGVSARIPDLVVKELASQELQRILDFLDDSVVVSRLRLIEQPIQSSFSLRHYDRLVPLIHEYLQRSGFAIFESKLCTMEETLERCLRRRVPFAQEDNQLLQKGDGKRKTDHGLKDWLIWNAANTDAGRAGTWGFISNDRGFTDPGANGRLHEDYQSHAVLFASMDAFEQSLASQRTFQEANTPRVVSGHFANGLSGEARSVLGITLFEWNWSPALLGFASDSGYVRITYEGDVRWTPKYWRDYGAEIYDVTGEVETDLSGDIECPTGYDPKTWIEEARAWGAKVSPHPDYYASIVVRRRFYVHFRITKDRDKFQLMCAVAFRKASGELFTQWDPSETQWIDEAPK